MMNIDLEQVRVVPAEKTDEEHKRSVWKVFNQNIGFNFITKEPVSYEQHCSWWENAFNKEFIYVIMYESSVCGYIRLTRQETYSKELNEISIAIEKRFTNTGIGSYAYQKFESEMRAKGISNIIAKVDIRNDSGQKFFTKNKFEKTHIRFVKKL